MSNRFGFNPCGRDLEATKYRSIKTVVANDDFTRSVTFDNDEEGVLDMKPHLGFGVFQSISDIATFRSVRVSFDTIEWDGGVDLDPEFVYAQCRKVERV